ncbi:Hypothetical Protein RSKD131_0342 [Cereibacter sphaeroides KD131]|nr:Hypothetical Protein RSKD131_0342 [Cereibacter sphaeroides KD131]
MSHIHRHGGATFFTPFMLFSSHDNRRMMIAHMAHSQAARDKMLGVHWALQNQFRHIGRGSLFELGYDARLDPQPALFQFAEEDRAQLLLELENELPSHIATNLGHGPLEVADLLFDVGNRTAAMNSDLFQVLTLMSAEKEVEVRKADGGLKRPGTKVEISDRLHLPGQRTLFAKYIK